MIFLSLYSKRLPRDNSTDSTKLTSWRVLPRPISHMKLSTTLKLPEDQLEVMDSTCIAEWLELSMKYQPVLHYKVCIFLSRWVYCSTSTSGQIPLQILSQSAKRKETWSKRSISWNFGKRKLVSWSFRGKFKLPISCEFNPQTLFLHLDKEHGTKTVTRNQGRTYLKAGLGYLCWNIFDLSCYCSFHLHHP